jgi:hypothetical protein
MALYEVIRVDDVQPGEFVSAFVIAGGVAQARKAVAHLPGVTKSNVMAERVDTTKRVQLISVYEDEQAPDEYAGDVSQPGSFNF